MPTDQLTLMRIEWLRQRLADGHALRMLGYRPQAQVVDEATTGEMLRRPQPQLLAMVEHLLATLPGPYVAEALGDAITLDVRQHSKVDLFNTARLLLEQQARRDARRQVYGGQVPDRVPDAVDQDGEPAWWCVDRWVHDRELGRSLAETGRTRADIQVPDGFCGHCMLPLPPAPAEPYDVRKAGL